MDASVAYALRDRLLGVGDGQGERVRIEIDEVLPPVSANPEALERILANLVSNALKYSPADAEVSLGIERQGDEAVVSVRDRGIGIAADDLARLFERYYRAKGTRERSDSLGLGLYITKGLVEAQRGRIWVESEVGKGSTFCFTLPLA